MVVDDDTHIRLAIKYRLEKEGYAVSLCRDGLDAVEKAGLEPPDLICWT